jgi:hypothetical protein
MADVTFVDIMLQISGSMVESFKHTLGYPSHDFCALSIYETAEKSLLT